LHSPRAAQAFLDSKECPMGNVTFSNKPGREQR
jgi:hypothetical protein